MWPETDIDQCLTVVPVVHAIESLEHVRLPEVAEIAGGDGHLLEPSLGRPHGHALPLDEGVVVVGDVFCHLAAVHIQATGLELETFFRLRLGEQLLEVEGAGERAEATTRIVPAGWERQTTRGKAVDAVLGGLVEQEAGANLRLPLQRARYQPAGTVLEPAKPATK